MTKPERSRICSHLVERFHKHGTGCIWNFVTGPCGCQGSQQKRMEKEV